MGPGEGLLQNLFSEEKKSEQSTKDQTLGTQCMVERREEPASTEIGERTEKSFRNEPFGDLGVFGRQCDFYQPHICSLCWPPFV